MSERKRSAEALLLPYCIKYRITMKAEASLPGDGRSIR